VPDFLDSLGMNMGRGVFVSEHEDKLIGIERGCGAATKPEDYLEGFHKFIKVKWGTVRKSGIVKSLRTLLHKGFPIVTEDSRPRVFST
jgi:hypothetical protein